MIPNVYTSKSELKSSGLDLIPIPISISINPSKDFNFQLLTNNSVLIEDLEDGIYDIQIKRNSKLIKFKNIKIKNSKLLNFNL